MFLHDSKKSCCHLGWNKILPTGHACAQSIFRSAVKFHYEKFLERLGHTPEVGSHSENAVKRIGSHHKRLGRKTLCRKTYQHNAFRFFKSRLGWSTLGNKPIHSQLLASQTTSTQKSNGAHSSNGNSENICKTWRHSPSSCRQFSNIQLLKKKWRKKTAFECSPKTFSFTLPKQQYKIAKNLSKKCRRLGRQLEQTSFGQDRVFHQSKYFSPVSTIFPRPESPSNSRHVCLLGKCKASKVCNQIALLPSCGTGCPTLQFEPDENSLCPSTLDNHPSVANTIKVQSSFKLHPIGSYVGFHQVVAPLPKNVKPKDTHSEVSPSQRNVFELSRSGNATHQVAPDLCTALRKALENQQISLTQVNKFLQSKPLSSYNKAFQKLWLHCVASGLNPLQMSVAQVGSALL